MKRISLLIPLVLLAFKLSVPAQDTAFTYQGHLTHLGNPANGNYNFRFALYGLPSGGLFLAAYGTNNVPVSNGLFTVTVDFGAAQFNGADRWLEIGVNTNGGFGYIPLSERQLVTATPYAVRALSAGSVPAGAITSTMLANGAVTAAKLAPGAVSYLGAPDGSPTNAVVVNANGLVGVGTNDPQAGLDIAATAPILSARRLFQVQDEMSGYTNLYGASSVAIFGNLLTVNGVSDNGVTVLDITNPQSPFRRAQFRDGDGSFTNLNGARGLAMKTNLLAVAAMSANAVTLVSLTNPASPVRLAELRDGVDGWNELASAFAVAISGNLMAIAARGDNAVTLADISNPSAPIKRVEMKDGTFGFTNLAGASSVAISDNLLAIGAELDDAVTLVDLTDPTSPVKLAELRDGIGGYDNLNGVFGVALSGGLLAIAANSDNAVTLVNVTDPASPVKLAELKQGVSGVDWLDGPTSVAFSGNWLAIGSYYGGVVALLDIANPSSPRPLVVIRDNVGGFNYLNAIYSVAFAGTNLAIAGAEQALTLASFPPATAGLVSQGWLGIGTETPGAALHVLGDVIVQSSQVFDINAERVELGIGTAASGSSSTAMGANATASGNYSTAMGVNTEASGYASTAMGSGTTASGFNSTAMGVDTEASGHASTAMGQNTTASASSSMAMGANTTASGGSSTAMGQNTTASGNYSTAMGHNTDAVGDYSTAMGRNAQATNQGAYVWTDSNTGTVTSTNNNSVTMRASGGYRLFSNLGASAGVILAPSGTSWGTISDREAKKNFQPLKGKDILEKLAGLPIQRWHYRWESDHDVPHIGPVAQDFKAVFYPGRDNKTITTLEFDGVALVAIQGLNQKVEEQRAELNRVKSQNQRLQDRLQRLENLFNNSPARSNATH